MMSEHKNLTKDEVKALMKHGLPAGTPSQLSDSFVFGMRYGKRIDDAVIEENQLLTTDRENAISLMSPSWKHAASKEPDLMTRYVTMAENQFKKKNEEIERLTEIATKHAAVNDERYELLEKQKSDIEKMLDQLFKHEKVDAWLVCKMNDMLDDVNHQLGRSQIDTVSNSNDDQSSGVCYIKLITNRASR